MPDSVDIPPALQKRLGILASTNVAETPVARIFKVATADLPEACLKIYKRAGMGNERSGVDLMMAWSGRGAVEIYDVHGDAVLMEWLGGASLGDVARAGSDREAARRLLDVAKRLHGNAVDQELDLPDLNGWFRGLFDLRFSDQCPKSLRTDIDRARGLARELLDSTTALTPLHGDLHHDNVRAGVRGDLAFDAKGIRGDVAYELANAFRHPVDRPDIVNDPDRIANMATLWSDGLGVEKSRLLGWASAKCALSMAWRSGGILTDDAEAPLLNLLSSAVADG